MVVPDFEKWFSDLAQRGCALVLLACGRQWSYRQACGSYRRFGRGDAGEDRPKVGHELVGGPELALVAHRAGADLDAGGAVLGPRHAPAATRGVPIDTVVADLASYVIAPGSWNGIVSIWCHLPPPLRRRVHAQVVQGLAPGGLFVLEAYSVNQLGRGTGGPGSVELLLTLDALRSELAGLDLLHLAELERDVHEGTAHTGPSSVVQVLARKPV